MGEDSGGMKEEEVRRARVKASTDGAYIDTLLDASRSASTF